MNVGTTIHYNVIWYECRYNNSLQCYLIWT